MRSNKNAKTPIDSKSDCMRVTTLDGSATPRNRQIIEPIQKNAVEKENTTMMRNDFHRGFISLHSLSCYLRIEQFLIGNGFGIKVFFQYNS